MLLLKYKSNQLCPQLLKIIKRLPNAFQIKPKFLNKASTFLHNLAPRYLFNFSLDSDHAFNLHCSPFTSLCSLCFLNSSMTLPIFFPKPRKASLVLVSLIKLLLNFQVINQSISFHVKKNIVQAFTVYGQAPC